MACPVSIYVFARRPDPGRAKTRIAARWGGERAAALACAMLQDELAVAVCAARAQGGSALLAHTPDEPGSLLSLAREAGAQLVAQGSGSLGERMARVLEVRRFEARIALGSDSPDLPAERIEEAALRLGAGERALIGPAEDGGYYLLGLGPGVSAACLADPAIEWGSQRALEGTLAALARAGIREVGRLPRHPDVDEVEDVTALAARLARGAKAPATARWLAGASIGRDP